MTVVTRFAPSPTGYLHIGGARTALFCALFAKHNKGKFLLRIEDTDRERSTQAAVDALIDGMKWMGLDWDGEPIFQFARASRHAEVAHDMVKNGKAYFCFTPAEELTAKRDAAKAEGKVFRFESPWRDVPASEHPKDGKGVVRLKAPKTGEVIVHDIVQGDVRTGAEQLDDMVLLRSDGTPTYMLAVVVDDHDMGITHVIRGDDHLTNAARQILIYQAMGWEIPVFGHVPMIHGPDGAKLSKRHGALGVHEYAKLGYLPETMRNYLVRLGWSHGDEEIISDANAVEWFDGTNIGKSPSRLDFAKLDNLNGHYIREADDARLVALITPFIEEQGLKVDDLGKARLTRGMHGLKQRAKTLIELAASAAFYIKRQSPMNDKAIKLLEGEGKTLVDNVVQLIQPMSDWRAEALETAIKNYAETSGIKLGNIAQPVRAALSGSNVSPPIFEVMEVLGREETLARLKDVC